jgi:adenylate kinase family enzyme
MKIAILGYSGSGKSTLAQSLGKRYGIPVLYLDRVHFLPGWKERTTAEARPIVAEFMERPSWVIDGNYAILLQEKRLEQADQIIFLDFPRLPCLFRAYRRYFRNRNTVRDSMAVGCVEKIDREFVRWILLDGRTKRIRDHYRDILARYPDKTVVLKNQRQLSRFLREAAER